ncbi:MAG: ABC transporter substrate-binding protein [Nitrososphaerales archaeon]
MRIASRLLILVVLTGMLVACAAPQPVVQTVVQTVVVPQQVEKPVVQTVMVPVQQTVVVKEEVQVVATPTPAPKAEIKGGPLEVGVLWEQPQPWAMIAKSVGDSLEKDFPGTKVTYTFNNTPARPTIELRWLRGDPLDVDFIFEGTDPVSWKWVDEGYLLDLTPYMEQEVQPGVKWKDLVLPIANPSIKYKGKTYSAPEQTFIWLLQYNQKMLKDFGVEPPKTWDDVLKACETIKAKGVAPIAMAGPINFYVGMWYDALAQRIVGEDAVMNVLYGQGKLADNPGFLKAAQEFQKLFTNGCIIKGFEGVDFTAVQQQFFQGQAAMIFMGSWLTTEMKDSIPKDFELGVTTFPTYEGGKGGQDTLFGRTLSWSVASASKNPELAVEYLKRFSTDPAIVKQRAEQLGELVPLVGAPPPGGMIGIDKVLEQAKTSKMILYNYGVNSDTGLASAWYNPMVEMAFGKITPEQMIANIDKGLADYTAQKATK